MYTAANNRIKFLETSVLSKFISSLEIVDLVLNVCIDDAFKGIVEIQKMFGLVKFNCKYERPKSRDNEFFCGQITRSEFGIYCQFGPKTNIDFEEYTIISNDYPRIQHLEISDYKRDGFMKNIQHLPEVNKFVRNVIQYTAKKTSVKTIARENFKGMFWLEFLFLSSNLIETVQKNTFQGLERIRYIDLGKRTLGQLRLRFSFLIYKRDTLLLS